VIGPLGTPPGGPIDQAAAKEAARLTMPAENKITMYGPKRDGTYLVEFRAADGQSLAISVPGSEAAVLRHFQARMPYGLVVPDAPG
jgi:hypothetical protein